MPQAAGTGVGRRIAWATVALAIVVAPLGACEYIRRYAVTVAYHDELNFAVPYMGALHRGQLSFADLAGTYYYHPVLFSRLVYLALAWLTRYSNPPVLFVSCALLGVVAWLWFADYRRSLSERSLLARLAWFAPAVWLLFSMRQEEVFDWSMALAEVLALTGSALAFFMLGRPERPGLFVAALASATAASLSTASGLLVWPVGCAYLVWIDRRASDQPRWSWRPAVWGAAGGVMLGFYFWSLPEGGLPDEWASFGQMARFILAAAGAPFGWGMRSSTVFGVFLLAVQPLALISLLRARRPTMAIPFLAFSLLNLGLMAAGRANMPAAETALSGRYTSFTAQGLVALYLWLAGWQLPPLRVTLARVALVATIVLATAHAAVEAPAHGQSWHETMRVYAYQLRNYRTQPDTLLIKLFPSRHPRAQRVRDAAVVLEELRFNVFREPPARPPGAPQGAADGHLDDINGRAMAGTTAVAVINAAGEPACEIRGWAINPSSAKPARQVFLEVDQQRFSGLYGLDRRDVAAARDDASLRYTGFYVSFATALLAPGPHQAKLLVVAADGRTFNLGPDPFTLVVAPAPH